MARATTRTRKRTTAKTARRTARSRRPSASRTPRRNVGVDPGLQSFLERLSSALTAGDAETAASCFEYPTVMVMSDPKYGPNQVLQDAEAASRILERAPEMYHERGIHDTFPEVEDVQRVAAGLLLVRARFPYIDADGNDMGDGETSLYVVRETGQAGGAGGGYAIAAAVTLGADSDDP